VTLAGAVVETSAQEYALLLALVERPGHVLSRKQLEDAIYALDQGAASNVIEVYVSRLRRKLGRDAIETVRGHGYRWGGPGEPPRDGAAP
jgi:two-component system OmpR family response regulator